MTVKQIQEIVVKAKKASYELAVVPSKIKDTAIRKMAEALENNSEAILKANKKDLTANKGLSKPLLERLSLSAPRINLMAESLREVVSLKDPVGEVIAGWQRPNGLWIQKVRVPIGLIAIIYESRPNVTSDCAALCLKSGNACILRGGREAIHT
ncbi:MAG TPA: gamma-glutamyl-phosphate reductase, partial [Candidatus Omnitrophica bacterium]|nr:gamma-glutamyl-phosphate reductase [Candidatus Omnitrophota bacterium]